MRKSDKAHLDNLEPEEVDLADGLTLIFIIEGPRRGSDPGPSTKSTFLSTTTSNNRDNNYPCSSGLASRSSSISSGADIEEVVTPLPTRSNSVDFVIEGSIKPEEVFAELSLSETPVKIKRSTETLRSPPNAKIIRRESSPLTEPITSLRMSSIGQNFTFADLYSATDNVLATSSTLTTFITSSLTFITPDSPIPTYSFSNIIPTKPEPRRRIYSYSYRSGGYRY
jgi:hypothetical protein